MRKSAFIGKGLVFLILSCQILFERSSAISAQEFGKSPFRECWRLESENLSNFAVASDNAGNLFLTLTNGSVEAVDTGMGKPLWHSEIGGEIISPIISDEKRIYVVSGTLPATTAPTTATPDTSGKEPENFIVRALSTTTGVTNWQKSFSIAGSGKVYLVGDSEKLFILTENGNLIGLNKQNGETCLNEKLGFRLSAVPFLLDGKFYLGTADKTLVVVLAENARTENKIDLKNVPTAVLAFDESTLYLGDNVGNMLALNPQKKGTRWKTWTGAEITSITKVPKGLLVSSFDNYVYLLSEKNGKRLWKKRLSGRSIGNPLVKDNIAVFSTLGGTDAVFIELKKGKSVNQLSIQGDNYFTQNPAGFNDLLVFPTFRGLFAFGSERSCKTFKK